MVTVAGVVVEFKAALSHLAPVVVFTLAVTLNATGLAVARRVWLGGTGPPGWALNITGDRDPLTSALLVTVSVTTVLHGEFAAPGAVTVTLAR